LIRFRWRRKRKTESIHVLGAETDHTRGPPQGIC
jgi:hypothetical protein